MALRGVTRQSRSGRSIALEHAPDVLCNCVEPYFGTGKLLVEPAHKLLVRDSPHVIDGVCFGTAKRDGFGLRPVLIGVLLEVDPDEVVTEEDGLDLTDYLLLSNEGLMPILPVFFDAQRDALPVGVCGRLGPGTASEPVEHRPRLPLGLRRGRLICDALRRGDRETVFGPR